MNPIEMSLNLKSLKMIDKSAVRIIDMSFRVAMFDFDVYKNKYNNCDKSGAMFVYERSSLPTYAFALLNTKNLQNAIEYLEKGFESRIQAERNICFKTTKTELKLLYFFEVKDVNRINNLFQKLCQAGNPETRNNFQSLHEENSNQFSADKIFNQNKNSVGNKTNANVNLVEMLNKAQTKYEQKSLPTSTAPQTSQLRLGDLFNRPPGQQPTTSSWSQSKNINCTVLPESAISVTELERQQQTAVENRVPKAIENTALNKLFQKPESFQNVLQKHENQNEISKSVPLNIPKPNVSQTNRKVFDSTCLLKNLTWNGQPSNHTIFSSSSKPKATKTNSLSPTLPPYSSSHLNDNFKNLLSNGHDLVKAKSISQPKTSFPLVKKTTELNSRGFYFLIIFCKFKFYT